MTSPLSSSAPSLFSRSPHTIYRRILSSLITMHKLCSLLPSSPHNSCFFPLFFLSPLSIRLRLSALLHPPSKYLWSLLLAVLGSLARALRSRRYADWLFFFFFFFFCKAVFEQAGRWVNMIKAQSRREEEKKVAGMTRAHALMPVCVQTSEEDASCRCRRTLLIFSSGKHGAHQEVEKQQRWRLHSQDWNWAWRKEKIK